MNRNTVLKFRVTEEENKKIREKAEKAKMNLSRYLRTSAVNEQIAVYNTADLYGFRTDIKRIGNNINQIAAVVNSSKSVYKKDFQDLQKEIEDLKKSIEKYLKPLSYEVF